MSPERPRYRVDRAMPIVDFGHVVVVEAMNQTPYTVTALDAQLRAYPGRPDIQNDIIETFEKGDAYVEES